MFDLELAPRQAGILLRLPALSLPYPSRNNGACPGVRYRVSTLFNSRPVLSPFAVRVQNSTVPLCWLLSSSTRNMSYSEGRPLFIFEPDDERSQHRSWKWMSQQANWSFGTNKNKSSG